MRRTCLLKYFVLNRQHQQLASTTVTTSAVYKGTVLDINGDIYQVKLARETLSVSSIATPGVSVIGTMIQAAIHPNGKSIPLETLLGCLVKVTSPPSSDSSKSGYEIIAYADKYLTSTTACKDNCNDSASTKKMQWQKFACVHPHRLHAANSSKICQNCPQRVLS
jgi:hypothetical protein